MSFEQNYSKFEATNAQVLGVSVDIAPANKAFAETNNLSFPLLSDTNRVTAEAYGVLYNDPKEKVLFRRAKRSWFVIDKQGIIRYMKITGPGEFDQNEEVLKYFRDNWQALGVEMEGTPYARALAQATLRGRVGEQVNVGVAYYASDAPLSSDLLSVPLGAEGVGPVYAVTIAILRNILCRQL